MTSNGVFQLPFNEEWVVLWGGDTSDLNAHHENYSQKYAYDFIQRGETASSYKTSGESNEDYYAFGKDVLSPADGVVLEASDGTRDNIPMDTNPYSATGNYIIIQHSADQFSLLAHLKCGSVAVKSGDQVLRGQKIGECGNSGNSSEPHIHYHQQSSDVFSRFNRDGTTVDIARGLKVSFRNIVLRRDDHTSMKPLYSPLKNDIVSNVTD